MARSANVQDIESLKTFRLALLKFAEKATSALGEADGDVQRVTTWLENDAVTHWTAELRKRHDAVIKAKEALRFKQIYKSPTGGKQSTADEEKAVAVATRRHAEAEQKMANVKKWTRQLHKESHIYRGSVQRLATTVSTDVPNAGAKILRMLTALEGYVALTAPSTAPAAAGGEGSGMSRGSGVPEIGAGHKQLRELTPAPAAKDAAPDQTSAAAWTAGEFAQTNAETLEKIPCERQSPDLSCTAILASGVAIARRIYLQRSPAAFPGDSGWYIGPTDAAPAALEAVKLADLLQARPHFAGLLSLPEGTLVVIDTAGIAAILNREDQDLWPE
jgi:hypothetical protein